MNSSKLTIYIRKMLIVLTIIFSISMHIGNTVVNSSFVKRIDKNIYHITQ